MIAHRTLLIAALLTAAAPVIAEPFQPDAAPPPPVPVDAEIVVDRPVPPPPAVWVTEGQPVDTPVQWRVRRPVVLEPRNVWRSTVTTRPGVVYLADATGDPNQQPVNVTVFQPDDSHVPVVVARVGETETVGHIGVVTTPDLPDELRAHLELPRGVGLLVQHVVKDSPAEKAGIRQHDVLHKLDDQLLVNGEQLRALIRMHEKGDEVTITVIRGAKPTPIKVTIGEKQVSISVSADTPAVDFIRVFKNPLQAGHRTEIELKPSAGLPPRHSIELAPLNITAGKRLAVSKDGEHVIELSLADEKRQVKVIDSKTGEVIYEGPADSDKLPEALKPKVTKLKLSTQLPPDHSSEFRSLEGHPDVDEAVERALEYLKKSQQRQEDLATELKNALKDIEQESVREKLDSIQRQLETEKLHKEIEELSRYMSPSHPRLMNLRLRLNTDIEDTMQQNLEDLRARVTAEMLDLAKTLRDNRFDSGDPATIRGEIQKRLDEAFQREGDRWRFEAKDAPGAGRETIRWSASKVYSDGEHTLTVTDGEGGRRLTVTDKSGKAVFEGLINTPEQRREVPSQVLQKLERLEELTQKDVRWKSSVIESQTVPAPREP